nr:hypothetical protein [Tanacetum cinerariifolium]
MKDSQFNKFKEDKLRVLLVLKIEELLQPQGKTMQLVKQSSNGKVSSYDSDVLFEESQDAGIQDTNSSAPNDLLVLSLVEQMIDHVANLDKENQTYKMVNGSLTAELERYKERVTIFE